MDAAIVRMIIASFIDGDPNQFEKSEQRDAVRWLEQRVYLTPPDKGAHTVHQPQIEKAVAALKEAIFSWDRGDKDGAKRYAEEAAKHFGT